METKHQITLEISGMICNACAQRVQQALQSVPGVEQVRLSSWRSGQASLVVQASVTDDQLLEAVLQASRGTPHAYHAHVRERSPMASQHVSAGSDETTPEFLIIGGGSAAFAAAIRARELGATVLLVTSGTLGGTCVNVGCVPSKTLIRAAQRVHAARRGATHSTSALAPLDWQALLQHKEALIAALRTSKYEGVAQTYGIPILHGTASFAGPQTVVVDGTVYRPRKILIATGSAPWAPPIPGLAQSGFLDSTAALSLPSLPASLIVVGAGAIGLELAQLFARLGVAVTVLEVLPRIAPLEEPELSAMLTEALRQEGLAIHTSVAIRRVERKEGAYRVEVEREGRTEVLTAEQLLLATGRRPQTAHLKLEAAGVETGPKGEILVNELLQTTNPKIYAAGDVLGEPMFVYVAAYAGALAAENALTGANKRYNLSALPRVTFTDPQIASVGLTEAQARAHRHEVKTALLQATDIPAALVADAPYGLIKLVADSRTGKLLGAHVLAPEAGEVIQAATIAIRLGLTYKDLADTFHPYLTWAEGLKLAAIAFEKDIRQLSCCAA
ncbi:Mercuric reductase [bacterium HR18]|nr:Mercuric reductase [bacterium HR18]